MSVKLYTILLVGWATVSMAGADSRLAPPGVQEEGSAGHRSSFDQGLYEDVIDEELCEQQLEFMANDTVRYPFLDASARLPSGIGRGNLNDLGNYHQCLAISEEANDMLYEGKYCTVLIPFDQDPISTPGFNITFPEIPGTEPEPETRYHELRSELLTMMGLGRGYSSTSPAKRSLQDPQARVAPLVVMASAGSTVALCIPKVCSTRQAVDFFQRYFLFLNFEYQEYYCRLPNDKPYSPADIAATVIFGLIALLCIASTAYDLHHIFFLRRDPKKANVLYRSFSLYTNMIRLLTFNKTSGSIECMDGIRAISMFWVMVGHTFVVTNLSYVQNLTYVVEWLTSFWSLWITSAPYTVDTFFVLSGILVIYGIINKMNRMRFIKTLHLYVANRLLRMFPVLAAVVLLQASFFNHLADGPYWLSVGVSVERCRKYWWSALLHVQNYVNPLEICLGHAWYISVDTQLYLLAPIVMIFLFGARRVGFSVLGLALTVSMAVCVGYSFAFNFPSAIVSFGRFDEFNDYMTMYYINTIARSPPFVIGMLFGYVLHVHRDKRIRMPLYMVACGWVLCFLLFALAFFSTYPSIQTDHDNQLVDNFLNGFIRSIWAVALGWLILACHHGYGGPINWLLSHDIWKLPARLSYAMFLLHFPMQMVVNGTWTQVKYFTTGDAIYRFLSDVLMTMLAAIALSLAIDSPFSTLQKLLMGGGGGNRKRPPPPAGAEHPLPEEVKTDASNGLNGVKISIQYTEEKTAL